MVDTRLQQDELEWMSPRSGRSEIAQQFTAGIRGVNEEVVREADG